jgi:gas vesicle protein
MADYETGETSGLSKGLLIGLFTGGALGAALALLFAPKSGRELRTEITDFTNQYIEKAGDTLHSVSERGSEIINEGKHKAEGIVGDAKQMASTLLSDAEKIVNDARAKATGAGSKISDATKAGSEAFKQELRS